VHHHHANYNHGPHEHGATDPNDQCCTLHHHLAGVLTIPSSAGRSGPTVSIVAVPPHSLSGTDPQTLERPPKLPLSI
jgi:hypothetical protein